MFKSYLEQNVIPRIVFIPFYITRVILLILKPFHIFAAISKKKKPDDTLIVIEAGIKGWESIEFKELYQSACEYLGEANVTKLVVEPDADYYLQVKRIIKHTNATHYVYDPRTGSQNWAIGLLLSLKIAALFQHHKVTPIVLLTDLSVRTWRAQSGVVTASKGVVVSFMGSRVTKPIFPHNRLIGPCLMPFSLRTKEMLDQLIIENGNMNNFRRAVFTGSLYEPRTTMLKEIAKGLEQKGHRLEIKGRELGSARVDDIEYWRRLINADIVITTSVQCVQSGTDWVHIPHFLYRYLEVQVCGSLLVAQDVPGVRRYFTPGVHFIAFENIDDAVEKIAYYLDNPSELRVIASQGKDRADALVAARSFWIVIDSALGGDAIN